MSDLPRPAATRLPRARWLDPRLLLGVLLVLVSVVVGAKVVASADSTYSVWGVRHDLGPRITLAAGDLVVRRVRLEGDAGVYVAADAAPPVGWLVDRALAAGELLPRAALVRPGTVATGRVSLPVSAAVAADLSDGAVVDVYLAPRADRLATGSPTPTPHVEPVLRGVTVYHVDRGGRGLRSASSAASVVLLLRTAPTAADGSAEPTVLTAGVPTAGPDDVQVFLDAQERGEIKLVRIPAGSR